MASTTFGADALATCAAELVSGGSLEISPSHADDATVVASLLPAGTPVFVTHLPGRALAASLPTLRAVHAAGLEPVPHLAARRVLSRADVVEFLQQAAATAGVRKVLLIGGDDPQPVGPYADGLTLLRDRVLTEGGLRELALPGYPEGHPRIAGDVLERAFDDKLREAHAQGFGVHPPRPIDELA